MTDRLQATGYSLQKPSAHLRLFPDPYNLSPTPASLCGARIACPPCEDHAGAETKSPSRPADLAGVGPIGSSNWALLNAAFSLNFTSNWPQNVAR
jgi:hypothetical protein